MLAGSATMNAQVIYQTFLHTLHPDPNVRIQAELKIRQFESLPGFIPLLMSIVSSNETDLSARLAASIYFKNMVRKSWQTRNSTEKFQIPEQDKTLVKAHIVQGLIQVPANIRAQLAQALNFILSEDFPNNWPEFIPTVTQFMQQTQDHRVVLGALIALQEVVRVYQWKRAEDRAPLGKIVKGIFPYLQQVASELIEVDNDEAAQILKVILKSYFGSMAYELTKSHMEESSMVSWAQLLVQVVEKPLPENLYSADIDEAEKARHPWWKAKKWAYHCLNRLFSRYGNPSIESGSSKTQNFARTFSDKFAPVILKAYLAQTEKIIAGGPTYFVSPKVKYDILTFFTESVKQKGTWNILKPLVPQLISHFIFPQLCFSKSDEELWESDPVEYIQNRTDPFEDFSSPTSAATQLLLELATSRRKQTFDGILQFINALLVKYNQSAEQERNPSEKDGALAMIGALADLCLRKTSKVQDQMELFLVNHVFPEFKSKFGFLRARALDVLTRFSDLDFEHEENALFAFQASMHSLQDPELPVRIEAALALKPLIKYDKVREAMSPNVAYIMQALLTLTNEIDLDTLAGVMEEFVEIFAQQLTPFAVQLCEQLSATFLRIMEEAYSTLPSQDSFDFDAAGDKTMAAMGVLKTVETLIISLDECPDIVRQLEERLVPVIAFVLDKEIIDLYDDVFEIIDACTFSSKSVSEPMWIVFHKVYAAFKNGGIDYILEMFPSLDNYISYGTETFVSNPQLLEMIVDIVNSVLDSDLPDADKAAACQLMESCMQHFRGRAVVDKYLTLFLDRAFDNLSKVKNPTRFKLLSAEVVVNALYYNPLATLQYLEAKGFTSSFFALWFQWLGKYSRVHDKKLMVATICSLVELQPANIPAVLQSNWKQMLDALLEVFKSYPEALERRAELEKLYDHTDASHNSYHEDDDEIDSDEEETEATETIGDEDDVQDEDDEYLEFLAEEAAKQGAKDNAAWDSDDDDGDLEEEMYFESPLDKMDPYLRFSECFQALPQTNPQSYQLLTSNLSPEAQATIMGLLQKAEEVRKEKLNS